MLPGGAASWKAAASRSRPVPAVSRSVLKPERPGSSAVQRGVVGRCAAYDHDLRHRARGTSPARRSGRARAN